MNIGVSGLAVGNQAGLGRLARICIIALASMAPQNCQLHVYLRRQADVELLESECSNTSAGSLDRLHLHYPTVGGLNRLILEELLLPRAFGKLGLDAYLGLDFTLPPAPLARTEAVMLPDLLPFTRPETLSWRAKWLYRRGVRRCVSRNARLLCISDMTRQALLRVHPDVSTARVVYPALSPKLMSRALKMHDAGRPVQVRGTHRGFAARGGYLLSVGITGRRKNTELLVQTYRELVLSGRYKQPLVLVGGTGAFHEAAGSSAMAVETAGAPMRRGDRGAGIYDIGKVTDYELSDLYRGADLLVSFSAEEGFGYPVLEALAHGTPALVTADSPMQEIAEGGIVATRLGPADRLNALISTIGALPQLRRETAKLDLEKYTIARLGSELLAALGGEDQTNDEA
jgi:glycosyltransferase involved in cell wall biosynthesis